MELYEGIRNALKNRGCPWIEEHVFEFMGQRLHLDIHDLGQNYSLKIVHRAADKDKMDKSEPYIAKNFSLEKTVAKSTLRRGSLKTICENLADGFLFRTLSRPRSGRAEKTPPRAGAGRTAF